MKICILYHPHSEFARRVEEYAQDFRRHCGREVELISLETRDGATTASLYDILSYPAVLALKQDGQLLKEWQGEHLPLMNEVAAYTD